MIRTKVFSLLLLLFLLPVLGARPDAPAPADPLEGLSAVLKPFDERMAQAARLYQERLDAIYAQYRKEGELDAILVIREERARFDAGGLPSAKDRVEYPPELSALQNKVLQQFERFQVQRSDALASACRKRIGELLVLQRELTRQDRIEEAVAVRNRILTLRNHPELGPLLKEEPAEAVPAGSADKVTPEGATTAPPAPDTVPVPPSPAPDPQPTAPTPPPAPPSHRVTTWDLEEPEGTAALPRSGKEAWLITGAVKVSGHSGNGIMMGRNFVDAVLPVEAWKSLAQKDSFTLGAWVRLTGPDLAGAIFSRQTEKQRGWVLRTTAAGLVRLEISGAGGEKLLAETAEPLPEGWNHLAFSLETAGKSTRAVLYVNGKEIKTVSAEWGMEAVSLPVRLGRYNWSPSFDLRLLGIVDTVSLGVPALPPAQIKELAQ